MGIQETLADYFDFDEHGTEFGTEVRAGVTTFLTIEAGFYNRFPPPCRESLRQLVNPVSIHGRNILEIRVNIGRNRAPIIVLVTEFVTTQILDLRHR